MTLDPILILLGYSVLATLAVAVTTFLVVLGIVLWEGRR